MVFFSPEITTFRNDMSFLRALGGIGPAFTALEAVNDDLALG